MDDSRDFSFAPIPVAERHEVASRLADDELARELTLAAAARTAPRRELFDVLLAGLERRQAAPLPRR